MHDGVRAHLLALGLTAVLAACADERSGAGVAAGSAAPTPDQWRALASRTVLFGHQSVGRNVLDGVRELAAEADAPGFRVVSGTEGAGVDGPALFEFAVGENGDPRSKAEDFAAVVSRSLPGEGGIALYKHCYLDVGPGTDVEEMFRAYSENARALQRRHPGLRLVHVTIPLTTVESAPEHLARRLLGRSTRRDLNAKRNRFNRLLRETYEGREPVFDLARVESTRADGSRSYLVAGSDTVYTLAPEWTEDGGHLNREGSRAAAAELLTLLAGL
jgi:hypothetical protein